MKRLFLFVILSVLGMTACNNADIVENAGDNTTVVSISASIPAKMNQTRAAGEGANVNRCIMEVYLDGELYGERAYAEVNDCKANFSVRLVSGKSYDFVFWADHVDDNSTAIEEDLHYNTTDLSNVTVADMTAYQGSDDTRDAFFGTATVEADYTKTLAVNLTRPFGQVKVKTLDMNDVPDDMRPTHVSVEFESVPTGIDLFTGELTSAASGITYTGAAALAATAEKEDGLLSFDYIFAPNAEGEQHLVNFTMQFLDDNNVSVAPDYEFSNIPVQRNYRTIVSGYLLTKKADINVAVVPGFDGEINSDEIEITASELQGVLSALDTEGEHDYNIHVTDNLTAGSYTLPALADGSTLAIDLAGAEGEVTFGDENFAGLLELGSTSADAIVVNINVPNGDAALNSGTWVVNSVSTKPTTFTVNEGATVTTLNVAAGNVVINKGATVESVARTEDNADAATTVTLFDGAEEPTITDPEIMVQEGVSGQITIGEKSFATIRDAVDAAAEGDVINIAEGKYDMGKPGQPDQNGPQGYYLKVDKKGVTLKGEGNVEIYTSDDANTGNWSLQNLVTVRAEDVTFENIIFVANYNGYYQGPNKTIEVFSNEGNNFALRGCTLVDGGSEKNAGCLYLGGDSGSGLTATVEDCTFVNAAISVRVNTSATIKGCTFDGIRETAGWNCSVAARGTAMIESCTFTNCTTEAGMQPVVANGDGYVVLSGVSFPTDGIYYRLADNGVVNDNGTLVAGSVAAFLSAQTKAQENGTILLQAGDYDFTTTGASMTGSNLEINKAGLTVKALDAANKPVLYASSSSGNWFYDGVYGQNTVTVTADNVTLENLVIMPVTNVGSYTNDYNKAIEVTNAVTSFTLKGCEITPNTKIEGNNKAGYGGQVSINTGKSSDKNTVKILDNTFTGAILDPRTAITATGNTFNGGSPTHTVLCRFRLQYDGSANTQVYSDIEMSGNTYNDVTGLNENGVLYIDGALVGIEAGLAAEFNTADKVSVQDGKYFYYSLK